MRSGLWIAMVLGGLLLAGCTTTPGDDDDDTGDDDTGSDDDTGDDDTCEPPAGGVIQLQTQDGVTIVADYYPSTHCPAPGVVLLHMIPPQWDRTSWPAGFITQLNGNGWTVIVPDRRGAGESGGVAEDAYQGPNGKFDVDACVARLAEDGYAGDLAIIGASNGTTSMVDYAAWAATTRAPEPDLLGYMSGGGYTTAQTAIADVPPVPAFFAYPTSEATWHVAQEAHDPGTWDWFEYDPGDHGTLLFGAVGQPVYDDIDGFMTGVLPVL